MRILRMILIRSMLATLAWAAVSVEVRAGNLNVAYINANAQSVGYLTSYGINLTNIDNPIGLTLAQLAPYDAILISPNGAFTESTNVGNVAAQFADSGRGVVLTAFALHGFLLEGAITTPAYSPLNLVSSANYINNVTLGTVFDPASPILAGVTPSLATAQYDMETGLNPGAVLVADWGATNVAGTRHAVAYTALADSSVVFVNLFPRGDTISSDSGLLVANALKFSDTIPAGSAPSAVPEPATMTMLGLGVVGLAGYGWRRRKRAVQPA